MANCHSSVKNPDTTTGMASQQEPRPSKPEPRPVQYSVSNLVDSVHRLENLCWHLSVLWKLIVFVFRWESPLVSLSFWITMVLMCIFMKSSQVMASCLALLLLAGAAGMFNLKLHSRQPPKTPRTQHDDGPNVLTSVPAQRVEPSSVADTEQRQRKAREALTEYRRLMLVAQDALIAACEAVEGIHAVMGWKDATWSPVFYGTCTIMITMLCMLPLRWVVMAIITSILCINRDFVAVVIQICYSCHNGNTSVDNDRMENQECRPELPEQKPKAKPIPEPEPPPLCHADIQHRPLHLCHKSKSLDEAAPNFSKIAAANRNRSSTAPELPTLKLNSAGLPVEVCFLCGTMFSVLKRRRYCRSCGNQFCQRCCSRKLPRAVFGATSPAALTEKELVCNSCYCAMTAEDANPPAGGATIEEH